jgi:hypothetical protein
MQNYSALHWENEMRHMSEGLKHGEADRVTHRHDPDDLQRSRRRLEALATTLDSAFRVPGTSIRVGADAVLNVIPGVGTLVAKGLSSYIILEARRLGVPRSTLYQMMGNVGVDFAISAIPIVGWFGDAFFRANSRNIDLLLDHIDRRLS